MGNLFLSAYSNKIDKKGRVSLPSNFREIISENNINTIIIYKSLTKECLEGCSSEYMKILFAAINKFDPFSAEKDAFLTAIFSESVELEFDKDGRINIPKQYISYAKIDDLALFIGKGNTFEIWNPENFKKYSENCRKFAIENSKMLKWN